MLRQAYPAERTEAFLDGHNAAFAFFGGVPRTILYDNTRLAVARILGDGNLQRDLKMVEDSYGDDVLNLVVARGYVAKLFRNPSVARYLERHQPDIARELQDLIETIGQEHTGGT